MWPHCGRSDPALARLEFLKNSPSRVLVNIWPFFATLPDFWCLAVWCRYPELFFSPFLRAGSGSWNSAQRCIRLDLTYGCVTVRLEFVIYLIREIVRNELSQKLCLLLKYFSLLPCLQWIFFVSFACLFTLAFIERNLFIINTNKTEPYEKGSLCSKSLVCYFLSFRTDTSLIMQVFTCNVLLDVNFGIYSFYNFITASYRIIYCV